MSRLNIPRTVDISSSLRRTFFDGGPGCVDEDREPPHLPGSRLARARSTSFRALPRPCPLDCGVHDTAGAILPVPCRAQAHLNAFSILLCVNSHDHYPSDYPGGSSQVSPVRRLQGRLDMREFENVLLQPMAELLRFVRVPLTPTSL